MDLFHVPIKAVSISVEELIESAITVICDLFIANVVCCVGMSGGKDSTLTLMLTLWSAQRAILRGTKPVVWVLNADTGVESPVIAKHLKSDLDKAAAYAASHGIEMKIGIARPSMSSGWLLRICGGRALPSFPENQSDCSVSWKVLPMQSLRKKLLTEVFKETEVEAVTLIGTRFAESASRSKKMHSRHESATIPVRNKAGDLVLAPISLWNDDDVWEALAMVRMGTLQSYSDTEALFSIYRDAGPTTCAVVNDSILEGSASSKGGCGARTGCWCCVKVKSDASMENFLDKPEYQFMGGLNDLRNFIAATQYDLSRRQWVGRTIEHRYVAVRPDAYSPAMMRELFRYVLTLQARENDDAVRLGISPRFQIITEAGIVGVDAMWSLNGFNPAFAAIEDFHDIFIRGVRYDIPKLETFPKIEMPEPRFLEIGDSWDDDLDAEPTWTGLRDPVGESLWEWSQCMKTRQLKDGRTVLDVGTDDMFSVDEESAILALQFDIDRILELREVFTRIGGYTQSYKWWLARGTISLAKSQVGVHDSILRRTSFKERWGLCGPTYDLDDVLKASIPWYEAPQNVQEAHINKAKLAELIASRERTIALSKQQTLFA